MIATMKEKLTYLEGVANKYGVDSDALYSIVQVESAGYGYSVIGLDKNNDPRLRIKIQFEPHIFVQQYNKLKKGKARFVSIRGYKFLYVDGKFILKNRVDTQEKEIAAFNAAWKVDPECTMLATSWGLPQIMGFNHKLCGFDTVGEMVDYMKEGEINQLDCMMRFLVNTGLMEHIRLKNWHSFFTGYNGKDYEKLGYAKKFFYHYGLKS